MMSLAITTLTAAANDAGITSVAEGSDTIKEAVKKVDYPLPRLEYSVLDDRLDNRHCGLVAAVRDQNLEHRTRRKYRRTLRTMCIIAAVSEDEVEGFFKSFLKNLPRHVKDGDGIDVTITPDRAERKGFTRKLADPFPKKEITVFVTFTGGIHTVEDVDLIKNVTITPEVS